MLLDMLWNRRSTGRGWEAEVQDKEKAGSHGFFQDPKDKSQKNYSENIWRAVKNSGLSSPAFPLPFLALCSPALYPTDNVAAASLIASNLFFNAKGAGNNGDTVVNPLQSQSEGQLSNEVWFYKPYLVESYYDWVVELVEPYYGCRILTPVMIWVKPRSNLQVQQEKCNSSKQTVWESQFVITIEYGYAL